MNEKIEDRLNTNEQNVDQMGGEPEYHTIVIGGGQAGLAAGYFLAQRRVPFLILDSYPHTGDSWRNRWDSLRLFTPSQFNGMPGKPFSKPANYFPAKDEVADYLAAYAAQFNLPVRHGVSVEALTSDGGAYQLSTSTGNFSAANVIVATGAFRAPKKPAFAAELDPGILQLHSSLYRNPNQVPAQTVLVVGSGNSGSEIALELANSGKKVWLAGRDPGRLPINSPISRILNGRLMWWFMNHVMTLKTPIGRRLAARGAHHGHPLGRARRPEIARAGVELTPRLAGVQSGMPKLEDGRVLPVEAVIWATGYHPDYSWIKLPIFDESGFPRHQRGMIPDAPGLYFLGLFFQTALISSLLGGVGTDAAYIVGKIAVSA